ncbi:MAG: ABC transporter ATP-binding protein [Acidimicrobiia bacterium]
MSAEAIRTEGLAKFYGKQRGVVNLDLSVRTGEIFGYLGPNGAGKTTTIRLLLDLIRPTAGQATVLGMDSTRHSVEINRRVGYLPGELELYEHLTGRALLNYFGELRGIIDWDHARALADRFEVDLDRRIGDLSTGNKQKIGLVQAFMHRPALLLLDEPTSGLDPLMRLEFYRLIDEMRAAGHTVFLSSHVLPEVERVADRVGIIREGRLLVVEEVETLKARAFRPIEIHFGHPAPAPGTLEGVDGVREARFDGSVAHLTVEGSVDSLVKAIAHYEVLRIESHEADLEEIFLDLYRGGSDGP